jgi:hypothetical protein
MIRTRRGGEALAYETLQSRLAIQVFQTLCNTQQHCRMLTACCTLGTQKLVLLLLKRLKCTRA